MTNEYLETLGKYIRYKKECVGNNIYRLYIKKNGMEFLEKALQHLEAIDNANPSEALECLESEKKVMWAYDYDIIKPTLLKAQEQEKVLEILKPYLRLVNNYLQAKMPLVDNDSWINIKEITDEEEFDLLKKILGQTQI